MFRAVEEGTLEVSLQGGNTQLPSFLICCYAVQFLFGAIVVVVSLVMY